MNEKSTNRLVLKNFSRFFESENIAVPDHSGNVAYILIPYEDKATHIVLVNDITERLHYINAIEEQNQRFKEIAWMHSHVMRTPVARIMSLVELLHNGQNTVELNTELLDYILQSAHELDKIIRDISDQTKH